MSRCRLSLWKYCISVCGVDRLISTGQCLQTQVSTQYSLGRMALTTAEQCSAATNHLITNAVFNISSDLIIICIPMPLLFKVRLPVKNKIVLGAIFCIGTFTIVAAVLNKYYSFSHPFGNEWTIWYLRESYTAILCANLPLTYPLIQRVFKLRNWSSNTYDSPRPYVVSTNRAPLSSHQSHANMPAPRTQPLPRGFRDVFRRTESQEDINGGLGKQKDECDPEFITSAIEMDDAESLRVSNISGPESWRTSQSMDERNKTPDKFHPV